MRIAVIGSRNFNDYEYFKIEFKIFLKELDVNYSLINEGAS